MANKFLTSKGLGKVLDSKISKKVMIPVGNKIIKGARKVVDFAAAPLVKEFKMQEEKDAKNKKDVEENIHDWMGVNKKGRSTSTGYMTRRG